MIITKLYNHVSNFYASFWQLGVLYLCEKDILERGPNHGVYFEQTNFGHMLS